jgi:hypothetical protein
MKIKTDFVTNSSSTAFVVFIPPTYKFEKNKIIKLKEYEDYIDDEQPSSDDIDKMLGEIKKDINLLKDGKEIMLSPYGYELLLIHELLENDNLIFKTIGVDGEGASTISPTKVVEVKEFITRMEQYENQN